MACRSAVSCVTAPHAQHSIVLLTARADEKRSSTAWRLEPATSCQSLFAHRSARQAQKPRRFTLVSKRDLQSKQQLEAALEQIKETESMLVQNEKSPLARLSAGLIHEINNPLNYARQGLHVLSKSAKHLPEPEQPDFHETLKDIEDGITRVATIISDLRGFTRETKDFNAFFDLKAVVDTGLRFFSHVWKSGMRREVEVPARAGDSWR